MMKIIIKPSEEVTAGSLNYGDTFQSASGRICMIVDSGSYIEDDGTIYTIVIVDLERGLLDRISTSTMVRPIKLVAREE